ncbi:MAG: type II CRISPR-associated endonuclease Cas1 [Alistipes senegalensis]|nr:type II CRISPR-associated endonuclease Cas1 [Oxalobacter formigenes]MCM1280750.1 type II CRISPR-associated endonuclease Cas1 [Alistipes senegalensis]
MSWRSVVISRPARLSLGNNALKIAQEGSQAQVPLEDIAVLIIDHAQVSLTSQLLSACANAQIAVITVGETHHPNGVLLAFHPHTRALKVMRSQLALTQPQRKRLWQRIVQTKIANQAAVLAWQGNQSEARQLQKMAANVSSGDTGNLEGKAAQRYFRACFESRFTRQQDRFYNAALNYGYAVVRSAIARSLVSYGFLPAFGLFHHNEQNPFNLADDLIEAYRPYVDLHILHTFPQEAEHSLNPEDKGNIVFILHQDVSLNQHLPAGKCTLLAAIDTTVRTLSGIAVNKAAIETLALPVLEPPQAKSRQTGKP